MPTTPSNTTATMKPQTLFLTAFGVVVFVLAAANWESFAWLISVWWNDPDYTHGFFVIPFSCLLLWDRREMFREVEIQWSWLSIPFLVAGTALAWYGSYEYRLPGPPLALVPLLLGAVLFLGGWKALRWSWSAILFLTFMVPLPSAVAQAIRFDLQLFATKVSVFILQTLGMAAVAQGNVIVLSNSQSLHVAEACSGLRMLMLFGATCVGAAFYLRREILLNRVLFVLSAIPIAIIANVFRITLTAFLHEMVNAELADKVFHDLAGWIMMPLAIGLLWIEMTILNRLFIVPEREAPLAIGVGRVPTPGRSGRSLPPRGGGAI